MIIEAKKKHFSRRFGGRRTVAILSATCMALILASTVSAQQSSSSGTNASTLDRRIQETAPKRIAPDAEVQLPKPAKPKPDAVAIDFRITLAAVVITGTTVFDASAFGPDYDMFLAREISIDEITIILERVTKRYRDAGYSLSRAIAPPQDLENGILTVQVIEGYVEKVTFSGDSEHADQFAGYAERLTLHRPMTLATLERYTLAIGDVSGYSVEPALTAIDEESGRYALDLKLTHKPIDGVALLNNRGTPEVGRLQTWLSGAVNSALGNRERLEVGFFTIPNEPEESLYTELTYTQTLGFEGTAFSISGALSTSDPGSSDASNDVESDFERLTLAMWHPLIRSRNENLWLRGTFEYRNFHERSLGRTSTNDRLRVVRGRLGYWLGDLAKGTLSTSVEVSKGINFLGESTTGSNDLSRFDGESDFLKAVIDIVRDQQVAGGFWIQFSAAGQISNDRLLSSEEFSIGGMRFGRGYDFSEITGDEGLALSIEPRYWWNLGKDWLSGFSVYGFFDWGVVWNDILDSGITRDTAASAGGGVRLFFPYDFRADFEVARPLTRPVFTSNGKDTRFFFALTKNY